LGNRRLEWDETAAQPLDRCRHQADASFRSHQPEGCLDLADLVHDRRLQSALAVQREHLVRVTRTRRIRVDDERLACEQIEPQRPGTRGERMA
jgi:hypothetical protein